LLINTAKKMKIKLLLAEICLNEIFAHQKEHDTGVCKIIAQRATVSDGVFLSVAGYCL
jgi:hypothetical protein